VYWSSGQLQIQRQLQRISGQGKVFTEPKGKVGRWLILLGKNKLAKLRFHNELQHQERQVAGKGGPKMI
jgi:hypothetical protein